MHRRVSFGISTTGALSRKLRLIALMLDLRTMAQCVRSLAPSHEARSIAPATFSEIMHAPGIVWDGASDATIWNDARTNHAFRAWHDAHHIAGQFGFTLEGEIATCRAQQAALIAAFPSAPAWALQLLDIEIIGQALYAERHHHFPLDQRTFTHERLTQ